MTRDYHAPGRSTVIAGGGKNLFGNVLRMRRVRHQDTTTFPSGIDALKYARP